MEKSSKTLLLLSLLAHYTARR